MLEVEVYEIRGKCPVYRVGDKIIIDDPKIVLEKTNALCIHALTVILHYALVLEYRWNPVELGLTKLGDEKYAYVQCVDPGQPYTGGGTVIFRIRKIK